MNTCSICGKSFKFQSGLSRHEAIHKANFKVKCSCGSEFSRSDNLKRHKIKCTVPDTILDDSNPEADQLDSVNNSITPPAIQHAKINADSNDMSHHSKTKKAADPDVATHHSKKKKPNHPHHSKKKKVMVTPDDDDIHQSNLTSSDEDVSPIKLPRKRNAKKKKVMVNYIDDDDIHQSNHTSSDDEESSDDDTLTSSDDGDVSPIKLPRKRNVKHRFAKLRRREAKMVQPYEPIPYQPIYGRPRSMFTSYPRISSLQQPLMTSYPWLPR